MEYESIRSLKNPRVKNLVRLRNGHHRRRQGRFLIEGKKEIGQAMAAEIALEEIYFAPEFFRDAEELEIVESVFRGGAPAFRLSREAFSKCAYRAGPDGFLATAKMWERKLEDIPLSSSPLLLVLENIEKPGNLGALLRTAHAAGADGVIVTKSGTDIFNPNVIRASRGSVFNLPVAISENALLSAWLEERGIQKAATATEAGTPFWEADLTVPTALLMGSEKEGLSESWKAEASIRLRIPMEAGADSLNVSAAGAIVLFEAVRQRRGKLKMEKGKGMAAKRREKAQKKKGEGEGEREVRVKGKVKG